MASVYKNGYLTRKALTSEIKIVVAKEHGLKPEDIKIDWLMKWRVVKFPTDLISKTGKILVSAPGFRSTGFCVYQEKNKKWYMR
jgi:hypothetical protein